MEPPFSSPRRVELNLRGTIADESREGELGTSQYDAMIVVPKSTLVTLRKRPAESTNEQPEPSEVRGSKAITVP